MVVSARAARNALRSLLLSGLAIGTMATNASADATPGSPMNVTLPSGISVMSTSSESAGGGLLAQKWTLSNGQTVAAVAPAGSQVVVTPSPSGTLNVQLTTSPIATAATVAAVSHGAQMHSTLSVYQRERFLGASPKVARHLAAEAKRHLMARTAYSSGQTIAIPCVSKSADSGSVFEQNCDTIVYITTLNGMYEVGDATQAYGDNQQGSQNVSWLSAANSWNGSTAHVVDERPTEPHSTGSCTNASWGLSVAGVSWGYSEQYCNGQLNPVPQQSGNRTIGWGLEYTGSGNWIDGLSPTDEALIPPGDTVNLGIWMNYN